MTKKVVVGLSGGVDSSVAAYLLKKEGYEVIGVTMLTWQEREADGSELTMVKDARAVAERLGIEYHVVDFREEFKKHVMDYFVEEYLQGRTPNPCVVCNRYVKWEALLSRCKEFGAEYVATGHYARIDKLPNGRYAIRNSITATKDQTYALYNLKQEQLAHTIMPIGAYHKEEVRTMAEEIGFNVARKKDSMEVCFIPDDDYAAFIEAQAGEQVPPPGNFVSVAGEVLGQHKGITHYTIGQRKGLGIALGAPAFVVEIRPETNEVVLGTNEDVFTTTLYANQLNAMAIPEFTNGMELVAKIRYSHAGTACRVYKTGEDEIRCEFLEPVRAVTPGQAVVFYTGEYVAGGGRIIR